MLTQSQCSGCSRAILPGRRRCDACRGVCSECGKAKPASSRHLLCAACRVLRVRARDPLGLRLSRAVVRSKQRAIELGIPWNLSTAFLRSLFEIQDGRCAFTGVQLRVTGAASTRHPHLLTLDRIENAKGYVPGNVVLCSFVANIAKAGMSLKNFFAFGVALSKGSPRAKMIVREARRLCVVQVRRARGAPPVERACEICGKKMTVYASVLRTGCGKTCSRACGSVRQKRTKKGGSK